MADEVELRRLKIAFEDLVGYLDNKRGENWMMTTRCATFVSNGERLGADH